MNHPERRKQKRMSSAMKAEGVLNGTKFPVWIKDFSTHGFNCFVPPKFPGGQFQILFSLKSPRDFQFLVQVCHGTQTNFNGKPCLRVGCRILKYPPEPKTFFHLMFLQNQKNTSEAPTQIQQPISDQSKMERRVERRLSVDIPAFCRIQEKGYRMQTIDIAKRGIAVEVPINFPPVSRFEIVLQPPDSEPIHLEVLERERKTIQGDSDRYRLGLRILKLDALYQAFYKHIQNPNKSIDSTKTMSLDRVEIRTPGSLPTLATATGDENNVSYELLGKIRYNFERMLGKGGFAEVYLVRDVSLNRLVAMKVLSAKFAKDPTLSYRFIAEAQIAAQFQHPNIAGVHEVGDIKRENYASHLKFPQEILEKYPERMVYFTMQYIQGKSLADILASEGKLRAEDALFYMTHSARALSYAHNKGVVHRDIKPENIMVTNDRQVLMTDFGIAKILSGDDESEDPNVPQTTQNAKQSKTQGFMGTPIYASPEQITAKGVDNRSDLYSFGVMAFELLVGQPPFKGKTWMETIAMHMNKDPELLVNLDASISQNLSDMVNKLMKKDPLPRFQSADELHQELERITAQYAAGDLQIDAMAEVDAESQELAKTIFIQFSKTYRIVGTYPEGHEMVLKAVDQLHLKFEEFFNKHERMDLKVESMALYFNRAVVLEEDQKENAFLFNLYRDGVRTLFFYRGVQKDELKNFVINLFRYCNDRNKYEEDCVTIMFRLAFEYIDFEYVDAFYEDAEAAKRLANLEKEVYKESIFTLQTLEHASEPAHQFVNQYQSIEQQYKKLALGQLQKYFSDFFDASMRREGVKILMHMVQNEDPGTIFDHQFQILEEVIFSNIAQNDLDLAASIFQTLDQWSARLPDHDPRNLANRILALKERLSANEFLNELVDKYFYVDRAYRDPIIKLSHFLIPSLSVKVLFGRFKSEEEEWKRRFLGDLCVSACGAVLTPLLKMSMELGDEAASIMLGAFSRGNQGLTRPILQQWAKHSGPNTRAHLVRLFSNRMDIAKDLMTNVASDANPKFSEARTLAWQFLNKTDPASFSKVISSFLNLDNFINCGEADQRTILSLVKSQRTPQAVTFACQVLEEHSTLGHDKISLEIKMEAANVLAGINHDMGWQAMQKVSKRLMGNRNLAQHCKGLLARRS